MQSPFTPKPHIIPFTYSISMQYTPPKGAAQLVHCTQLKDILFLYVSKSFKFVSR